MLVISGCKSSSGPSDKITINVPNEGYVWEETVQFEADISISKKVSLVSWLLNGSVISVVEVPPYSITFNTSTMTYGDVYDLSVIVRDEDNNEISSDIYEIIRIPFNIPSSSFNDISGYTETDDYGNLGGTIDQNDWRLFLIGNDAAPKAERYATIKNVNISSNYRKISISWEAEDEYDNLGYNIYRGTSSSDYNNNSAIHLNYYGLIPNETDMEYTYVDSFGLNYNNNYYYWIEIVNSDNTKYTYPPEGHKYTLYNPDELIFTFHKCYPNPVGSSTTLPFTLEENSEITFMFFNSDKSYFEVPVQDQVYERGYNTFIWNDLPQDAGLYRCLYYIKCLNSGEIYYGFGDIYVHSAL